jgi:PAS domain S-box-containing protein
MPGTTEPCRSIIDAIDDGICSTDTEDRTTFVNRKLADMLGFHTEEVRGRPILDFVDERWHHVLRESLQKIRRGIRGRYEVQLLRKDRTKLWVSFNPSPLYNDNAGGSYAGSVALVSDISREKGAQEDLRLSEERLRMALSAAGLGLWDWDIVADRGYLGAEYLRLTGYGEGIVHPALAWFKDRVHPEDARTVTMTLSAHLEGKTPESFMEYRMRRSTGDYLWVRAMGRVMARDDNGAPLRMMGVISDISEQKKTEGELASARRGDAQLRAELEQVTRAAGTVSETVANLRGPDISAVLTTLALQAQALTGAKYAAAGIGTDPEKPFEPWISVGVPPHIVRALGRFPRPVGVLGEVALHGRVVRVANVRQQASFGGLPSPHPELTSFLGVPLRYAGQLFGNLYLANKQGAAEFSPEDERKVQMLAARAAVTVQTARLYAGEALGRAWLGTTIDQLPEGVVLLDRVGHIVAMNRAAMGFSCGESHRVDPFGNPAIFDLCLPDGTPLSFDDYPLVRALRQGEVTLGRELIARTADGRRVPILTNAAPIYDLQGEIAGAANLVSDITTMKELERLREEWSSAVAHDLKQPVSAITLDVQTLLKQGGSPPELVRRVLERMRGSAARLNRMISDLFSASLIEARRLPLERRSIEVASFVKGVVDELRRTATGRRIDVTTEGAESAWVDPDRVRQVLENLISNATKYAQPDSAICVDSAARDGFVELTVTNRGVGIEPEELPTVFSRFRRAKSARAERIPGLGLGLYIAKGIVDAHGGRIWAESVPGDVTSFHFTLPRTRPADHPQAAHGPPSR